MHGGIEKSRQTLIKELVTQFEGELVCLSSAGFAAIVTFHKQAAINLKIVKDDTDDDINAKQSNYQVKEVVTRLK